MVKWSNYNFQTDRIYSLQALRAIAFLGVFTSHCEVSELGAWGVSIFVVLSGFLMFFNYSEINLDYSIKSSIEFSTSKIKKLYPLHLLMTICAAVFSVYEIINVFSVRLLIKYIICFVLDILLLQDWIPYSSVFYSMNGVSWYLSLCLFIYGLFPLILSKLKKIKSCKQSICIAVVLFIVQFLVGLMCEKLDAVTPSITNLPRWATYIFPIYRVCDFTIGCCCAYIYKAISWKPSKQFATVLEIIALCMVVLAQFIYQNQWGLLGTNGLRYTVIYVISSCLLVYLFTIKKGIFSSLLTNRLLIYLGNISGYAFLIHQIVIRYFKALTDYLFGGLSSPYILILFTLLITIIVSELYMTITKKLKLNYT